MLDASGAVRSAQEHVSSVFTPANFTGIRSLPNALSPYFRELLYQELVQSGKLETASLQGNVHLIQENPIGNVHAWKYGS